MGTLISLKGRIDGKTTDLAKQVLGIVLDAVTSPGKIRVLPPPDREPPAPWPAALSQVAQALLSSYARFAVTGQGAEAFARHLVEHTGAQSVALQKADYVIAGHPLDWLDVWAVAAADRASRRGATLMLSSQFLLPTGVGDQTATLAEYPYGVHEETEVSPNTPLHKHIVRGRRALTLCEPATSLLLRLAARIAEHPTHIDVVLADSSGRIVALPHGTWWSQSGTIWAA